MSDKYIDKIKKDNVEYDIHSSNDYLVIEKTITSRNLADVSITSTEFNTIKDNDKVLLIITQSAPQTTTVKYIFIKNKILGSDEVYLTSNEYTLMLRSQYGSISRTVSANNGTILYQQRVIQTIDDVQYSLYLLTTNPSGAILLDRAAYPTFDVKVSSNSMTSQVIKYSVHSASQSHGNKSFMQVFILDGGTSKELVFDYQATVNETTKL
jgi:hypothetical protein